MDILNIAKIVFEKEALALSHVASNLDFNFELAVSIILNSSGRVIVCGMGKSGIVGKKIAASFASTGTPSFFMHPGEAFHGDLGMVTSDDIFLAISNSGETDELLKLLPFLNSNKNTIISLTGNPSSTLSTNSSYHLNINVPEEACPLQLAPTSSTTATMAMGDALTVALMSLRDFKPENFARFHPGGRLGKKLLSKVSDEMYTTSLPLIHANINVCSLIDTITSHMHGLAIVLDNENLVGVITDGDLRRGIEKYGKDVFDRCARDLMSINPKTISPEASMEIAIEFMDYNKINHAIVVENDIVIGILKR